MMSGTERILRERYAPNTLPSATPVQKSQATWTLVMKASECGEDYVFEACNQHNKANGRQPYQSFVLPADLPGVGCKGDWVVKRTEK
ncbi:hypothetical protein PSYRMG_25280 [Pseudomonas syringae UMAF0158]|nr:hypothetical protein PSYRMG_25280 [Pseudomonas syringae UMAF0158]